MFEYDDLDYMQLVNDPEIDPDSPEALYALAQFCRTGKGIEPSEEKYRNYLTQAAQAGSEQARQELDEDARHQQENVQARTDEVQKLSLGELIQGADRGIPGMLLPAVEASLELNDVMRAERYLNMAAQMVPQGTFTVEESRTIWLRLAELREKEGDAEGCRIAYGQAQELGSWEAALKLAEFCRSGYGCEKNLDQAVQYANRGLEKAPVEIKLEAAKGLAQSGRRLDAAVQMEDVIRESGNEDVRHLAEFYKERYLSETLTESTVAWLWELMGTGDQIDCTIGGDAFQMSRKELTDLLGGSPTAVRGKGLPLPAEQAYHCALVQDTPEQRLEWLQDAAFNGSWAAQVALGDHYRGLSDAEKAEKWYEMAAEQGSIEAVRGLAGLYADENSAVHNDERAFLMYQKLAQQGDAEAAKTLGDLYREGCGVPQSDEKAAEQYRRAAETGEPWANYWLGCWYQDGHCVEEDPVRAKACLERAAQELNRPEIWYRLSQLCRTPEASSQEKANNCLRKAAHGGNTEATQELVRRLLSGDGIERNEQEAVEYLDLLESDDPENCLLLAECLREGRGIAPDPQRAIRLYDKALEGGCRQAGLPLAELRCTIGDPQKGIQLAKALQQQPLTEEEQERLQLAVCWAQLRPDYPGRNPAVAAKNLQRLAECDGAVANAARSELARLYEQGDGVEQDRDRAEMLYRQLGDEKALRRIEEAKAEEERLIAERKASEERRIAEAKAAEERRLAEEARRLEWERLNEERRRAAQKAAEERRLAEAKAAEARRIAEAKAAQERRIAEERAAEERRRAEEARRLEEERAAEERRLAEEARRIEAEKAEEAHREEVRQNFDACRHIMVRILWFVIVAMALAFVQPAAAEIPWIGSAVSVACLVAKWVLGLAVLANLIFLYQKFGGIFRMEDFLSVLKDIVSTVINVFVGIFVKDK